MKSFLKLIIFSLLFWASSSALATIKITAIGGVSNADTDANNNIVTVYGGIAGGCTGDGSGTCNSCTDTNVVPNIRACNQQSVYANLSISITFSSDQTLANAVAKIVTEDQGTTTDAAVYSGLTNVSITAQVPTTVSVPWSYLCENDPHFSNACTPSVAGAEVNFGNTSRKIHLRVDQNNDGDTDDDDEKVSVAVRLNYLKADDASIATQTFCTSPTDPAAASSIGVCGYMMRVGDKKFSLDEVYMVSSAQASGSPAWAGIALVAAPSLITNVSNSSGIEVHRYTDDTSFEVADKNFTTGLQNYTLSCMAIGNVNKAMNIYRFSVNGIVDTTIVCKEPSEVVGMLEDKSCFISTAAFGSDMADQVQLLRNFRDQYLIPHSAGRSLVKFYYQVSPSIAHFIETSEILKATTRTMLYPVIGVAWMAVNFGLIPVVLILFSTLTIIFYILRKRTQTNRVVRNV